MSFWSDPVGVIAGWLGGLLRGWGLSAGLVHVILTLIGVVAVASFGLLLVIFLIWLERKVAARIQDRLGPNRAGPFGLLQTIADVIKLLTKEVVTPAGADKFLYDLAPILSVASVLLLWAVIPFADKMLGTDLNVGVLYLVAVGAFGTLAIILAGWSSNNKYALLGAFRTVAQLVSYEVPMVIALLVPVILARSMGVGEIVRAQSVWYVVYAPLAALIFFITSVAEVGRTPFDLLEAESEIVAGFHIEYSGMKFAMFFAGEFLHAFTISALTATLFLGGWRGMGASDFPLLGFLWFILKTFAVYFVVMWIRSTLPRVRIDHMLAFNWKFLTPLSLTVLMVTAVVDKAVAGATDGQRALAHLAANLVIAWATLAILRRKGRRERQAFAPRPLAVPPQPPAEADA